MRSKVVTVISQLEQLLYHHNGISDNYDAKLLLTNNPAQYEQKNREIAQMSRQINS